MKEEDQNTPSNSRFKPFEKTGVEGIAEKTKVDEFSKKLSMREDLLILVRY
ncbi:MAG: hypothetical protein SVK08_09160 [Halobacteriota archaeon]|nr:hypothetical protein [Halobacteriota archaeon]